MPVQRRFLLSAITNWLAFAATLLVAFFLSPYLVRTLGSAHYGVWVFVESILAYFTLFDLGIAACVVRYVAKFHTADNRTELNRLVSSCIALFFGLGLIAFAIGFALTPLLAPLMRQSGMEQSEIIAFTLLMLGNLAISLPLSVFPSILDGLERFAAKSVVRVVFLALRTTATIMLMQREPSLLGLGIIFTLGTLGEHLVFAILCFVYLPGLRFALRYVNRETMRMVRGYSVDAFLAMVAGRICVQSGAIVIGIFLTAPEITWFAIALRLVEFAKALLRSATMTLTPAISSLDAAGDADTIRRILFNGTRWALYLILPVHLGLIMFGRPFLRIWMGSVEYADHCYPALLILSGTLSLVVAQSVATRILYGMGKLRRFAQANLAEACVNLTLSLLLVRQFGVIGISAAAAIPNLFIAVGVIGYVCRLLQIKAREYCTRAWLTPIICSLAPVAVWSAPWIITGWGTLGVALAAGLVPYALCILVIEKRRRLRRFLLSRRARVLRSLTLPARPAINSEPAASATGAVPNA